MARSDNTYIDPSQVQSWPGHPRPHGLAELHQQLLQVPALRSELLSFIAEAQKSGVVLHADEISRISVMCNVSGGEVVHVQAPQHHMEALMVASSMMRSQYEEKKI